MERSSLCSLPCTCSHVRVPCCLQFITKLSSNLCVQVNINNVDYDNSTEWIFLLFPSVFLQISAFLSIETLNLYSVPFSLLNSLLPLPINVKWWITNGFASFFLLLFEKVRSSQDLNLSLLNSLLPLSWACLVTRIAAVTSRFWPSRYLVCDIEANCVYGHVPSISPLLQCHCSSGLVAHMSIWLEFRRFTFEFWLDFTLFLSPTCVVLTYSLEPKAADTIWNKKPGFKCW